MSLCPDENKDKGTDKEKHSEPDAFVRGDAPANPRDHLLRAVERLVGLFDGGRGTRSSGQ